MKRMTVCISLILWMTLNVLATGPVGSWSGHLEIGPQTRLRIVFNFKEKGNGDCEFSLDSPDQGAKGISGEINLLSGDSVSVSVRKIGFSYEGRILEDRMKGTVYQGGLKLPLELTFVRDEAMRPQTPKPPFPYSEQEVKFANGDAILAGTLLLPDNHTVRTPAVLLVSGSGLQNRDEEICGHKPFLVMADWLARHGIASLRYDDCGAGASTGDPAQATTHDFSIDAASGIRYLRRRFDNVGIIGHSEGGRIAFMLAGRKEFTESGRPGFVITIGAPAMRGDSILAGQNEVMLKALGIPDDLAESYARALIRMYEIKKKDGAQSARNSVDIITETWPDSPLSAALKENMREAALADSKWIDYFLTDSPGQDIAATDCPVLALYGSNDTQVLPANAGMLKQLNPKARIMVLPGLNHLMQTALTGMPAEYESIEETMSPEALNVIVGFIKTLNSF